MQLIVFIRPSNFDNLFRKYCNDDNFITLFSHEMIDEEGYHVPVYFNTEGPEDVIYINQFGTPEKSKSNQEKALAASIIIIPDKSDFVYSPITRFHILRHTTEEPVMFNSLISNSFYNGFTKQKEEKIDGKETMYYKLVNFIGNRAGKTFDDFCKENIILVNTRLEATLDFLKECLEINSISKNTDYLKKEGLNIECLKNKGIDDLSDVRDRLLEQCQIHNQSL